MFHSESKLINSSNLLDEKIKCGELSRDTNGINAGTSMKDKNKKILLMEVVIPKENVEVMNLDHILQHLAQHVSPYHIKKQPLTCHHYGKYGHTRPYCFKWIKLKVIGCKDLHVKKKWKSNVTSTRSITHTEHKSSSSKCWYFNSESTRHMDKDKITHGNRAKGRIKGSRKLVNPGQEEVLLRK